MTAALFLGLFILNTLAAPSFMSYPIKATLLIMGFLSSFIANRPSVTTLTVAPSFLTSKWRCGPPEEPVFPPKAINSPLLTGNSVESGSRSTTKLSASYCFEIVYSRSLSANL